MNKEYLNKYEELVSDKDNDFSKIMNFIKELQTNVTEEKISFYFSLLKDERNVHLFLTLRAFFRIRQTRRIFFIKLFVQK